MDQGGYQFAGEGKVRSGQSGPGVTFVNSIWLQRLQP